MRVLISIMASLLVLTAPAHAISVTQTVYEGRLAKANIVVEVLTADDPATHKPISAGRYFYRKHRVDIPFTVTAGVRATVFQELKPSCVDEMTDCKAQAEFTLNDAAGGYTGTWKAIGARQGFMVTLKQVATRTLTLDQPPSAPAGLFAALGDNADMATDPYQFRRVSAATTYTPETLVGRTGYHTATDTGTGIHFIQLTRSADPAMTVKVNHILDQRRFEMVDWGLDCLAGGDTDMGPASLGDWETYDSKVSFATDTLLVVQEGGGTFCGGAYPNNSFTYSQYDLKRGEILDITHILNLYTDKDSQTPTPAFAALKAKLTPQSPWFVAKGIDPECLAPDLGYDYSLSFSARGLVFSLTDLPHVIGACMDDFYVVPYAQLTTLWTRDAAAYFPQYAR